MTSQSSLTKLDDGVLNGLMMCCGFFVLALACVVIEIPWVIYVIDRFLDLFPQKEVE